MKEFLKEAFSMQEKRISTIILCLVACICLSFYLYLARNDIPETLLTIITTQTYIIGGVNGVNVLTKAFSKKLGDDEYDG
jgi:hypothetical protein